MKNSVVLASLLFGSFAVAVPLDPRAMVYKTEVVVETVVVYTTVYDDEPVAQAASTLAGYSHGHAHAHSHAQPKQSSSAVAVVTSSSSQAPASTPPVEAPKPSSTYVAPAPQVPTSSQAPAPTSAPAPVETPNPIESPEPVETPQPVESSKPVETPQPVESPKPVETPQPVSSAVYVAPAPVSSAEPVTVASTSSTGNGGAAAGDHSGDITQYTASNEPACGTKYGLAGNNNPMVVAIAQATWDAHGGSSYNRMTGEATNPLCGKKLNLFYKGQSHEVEIVDLCAGCAGANDVDLSPIAWYNITGSPELTRFKATWSWIE